jgi:hypothetical protein
MFLQLLQMPVHLVILLILTLIEEDYHLTHMKTLISKGASGA